MIDRIPKAEVLCFRWTDGSMMGKFTPLGDVGAAHGLGGWGGYQSRKSWSDEARRRRKKGPFITPESTKEEENLVVL